MSETDLDVLLSQYPGPKVADYCAHIRNVVRQRPHVLFAYAWCYYMAVFSGGRWIRAQLMEAGEGFWRQDAHMRGPLQEKGLALWNFDGDCDGEDIKAEFKSRLAGVENLLSLEQRQEIIEEAKEIFRFSAVLVDELDEKLQTNMSLLKPRRRAGQHDGSQDSQPRLRWAQATAVVVAVACVAGAAFMGSDGWLSLLKGPG